MSQHDDQFRRPEKTQALETEIAVLKTELTHLKNHHARRSEVEALEEQVKLLQRVIFGLIGVVVLAVLNELLSGLIIP